jgi:hypothetical protein
LKARFVEPDKPPPRLFAMESKPLEVTINPKPPTPGSDFGAPAVALFADHERIQAEATEEGLRLHCIWWPDLDDAWSALTSRFDFELSWGTPTIRFKYGSVMANGKPRNIILEPVLRVEVDTPETHAGSVIGDLSSRRGMITGMADGEGGRKLIAAEVPLSELSQYPKMLQALTAGGARVVATFHSYRDRPHHLDPDPDEPMSAALRA